MSRILNTSDGRLTLPNGVTLQPRMSLGEIASLGISFVRVTPDRTGFVWRSMEPFAVAPKRIYFAPGFDHDVLTKVEFGFTAPPPGDLPALEKRREHDKLLATELGPPSHTDLAKTLYDYPWGRIISHYDARTDNSSVIVSWL